MLAILVALAQAVPVEPKPVHLDFETVDIRADADRPDLRVFTERPPARFVSRLKVRTNFDAEIASSANEVR